MKLAFVFPGQGSQSLAMMSGLVERFSVVRETFSEASGILGYDLWQLVQDGPEEELNRTSRTQPAMLCAGVATWRCWHETQLSGPDYLAGHSLGEYSALVCAGAMAFSDALSLVEFRGLAMQEAVEDGAGAMAAVLGLSDDEVRGVCVRAADGEVVEAVNFNAPGQVVIAGERGAVARACNLAKEAGAKRCIELPVSVPSHCALMKGAADRLAQRLREITIVSPGIPVVHNVDVSVRRSPDEIRAALVSQLSRPVRWVETIQWLREQGVTGVLECGPGKVLAGLNRRIDRTMDAIALVDAASFEKAAELAGEGV